MTEILFERSSADEYICNRAYEILNSGGMIVVPTDTIPGMGCRADNHEAVVRLFKLKERPENLPVPVVLADTADVRDYAIHIPPVFDKLAERYWPGQLTIVLESNGKIDPLVGGGLNTIGFRVPDYPLIADIVRAVKAPLALTSANPHDLQPSAMHERLLAWWKNQVELIVLGRSTAPRSASAVVDLVSVPHRILREGIIDTEELSRMIA